MSTSVKFIRLTILLSTIFLVITYAISLVISYEWFDFPFLSNTFLITIFGGAFASMLVVLVCEIQKYFLIKRDTENQIFKTAGTICGKLIFLQFALQKVLENKNEIVSDTCIREVPEIQNAINIFKNIDYTSFTNNNAFQSIIIEMREWLLRKVTFVLNDSLFISIAINNDKIDNLKKINCEGVITSQSPNTNKVLMKFYSQLSPVVSKMEDYMSSIDKSCKNRYYWELAKLAIEKSWHDMPTDLYDEYIK